MKDKWRFLYWDENHNDEEKIASPLEPFPIREKNKVRCSKCGAEFDYGPILYSCYQNDCPLFPKNMC